MNLFKSSINTDVCQLVSKKIEFDTKASLKNALKHDLIYFSYAPTKHSTSHVLGEVSINPGSCLFPQKFNIIFHSLYFFFKVWFCIIKKTTRTEN